MLADLGVGRLEGVSNSAAGATRERFWYSHWPAPFPVPTVRAPGAGCAAGLSLFNSRGPRPRVRTFGLFRQAQSVVHLDQPCRLLQRVGDLGGVHIDPARFVVRAVVVLREMLHLKENAPQAAPNRRQHLLARREVHRARLERRHLLLVCGGHDRASALPEIALTSASMGNVVSG